MEDTKANLTSAFDNYTPVEMVTLSWKMMLKEWDYIGAKSSNVIVDLLWELKSRNQLVMDDFYAILLMALLFTVYRYLLVTLLVKPIGKNFEFSGKDKDKFRESSCKITYCLFFSVCEYYLINYRYPHLQRDVTTQWDGWYQEMAVPMDIKLLYLIEAGYYIHAIYATLCLDAWKKDSIPMLMHHILTECLLVFSLGIRYHLIGLVVLYLHDSADVILEATRLVLCLNRATKWKAFDVLSGVGFVSLSLNWFWCRLVRYPRVVMFSSYYVARATRQRDLPFYFFFNGMLLLLFFLNVYWFHFMLLLLFRILTGQSKCVEDTSEYRDISEKPKSHQVVNHHVENDDKSFTKHKEHLNGSTYNTKVTHQDVANNEVRSRKINGGKVLSS